MSVLVAQFGLQTQQQLPLRYNVAPTQLVAAVRVSEATKARELALLRWGLVPSWANDLAIGNRMINARAETIAEKTSFRSAFKRRRCLILADGYYEWQKVDKKKQPYLIHMPDGRPFAFAGLWEPWRPPASGDVLESCTIITTEAAESTKSIHDRMPVILDEKDYDLWLDPAVEDRSWLEPLLRPYQDADLIADPVNVYVNNPKNDDPRCIEPASV